MDKLDKFIKLYQVSDAESAKILGVSPGALCEWKSGKRKMPWYVEKSIDLHLDIPAAHMKRIREIALNG